VTIANALQLEAAGATPAFSRFITTLSSLTSLNLSVFAADTSLYAVTLTFDLEHLRRIACDVMKLCIKFERNRAIGVGVIEISMFDLTTLK